MTLRPRWIARPCQIRRLIDYHRGIARSGRHHALAGLHGGVHYTAAAGDADQRHVAVAEKLIYRVDGRRFHGTQQVAQAHVLLDFAIEHPHGKRHAARGQGVGTEYRGISTRQRR